MAKTTAFDRLLAFSSTLRTDLGTGAYPFYFQRNDADSPVSDYRDNPRNQQLYAYLQTLTSTGNRIPGFGGSFEGKYSRKDRNQILTEIFDYIRISNLYDATLTKTMVNGTTVNLGPNYFIAGSSYMVPTAYAGAPISSTAGYYPYVSLPFTSSNSSIMVRLTRADKYQCRAFTFRATGDANLSSARNWFITLHKAVAGDAMPTPPPNFVTIQIDPLGGAITVHRP